MATVADVKRKADEVLAERKLTFVTSTIFEKPDTSGEIYGTMIAMDTSQQILFLKNFVWQNNDWRFDSLVGLNKDQLKKAYAFGMKNIK